MSRFASLAGVVIFAAVAFSQPSFAQTEQTFGQGAVRPGNGIAPPSIVRQVEPRYTDEARRARVSGDVELEAVVKTDGTVGDVRVVRSLDDTYGLDANAVSAARQWRFKPGLDRDGHPVPVIVTLILSFRVSPKIESVPTQAPVDEFVKGACRIPSEGATAPRLAYQVEPKYTPEAMRAKIAGTVTVEAIVDPDGTVARPRVVESLDKPLGLDDEALKAVSQWTFEPDSGKCQGLPAPVLVTLVLTFRIH